MSARHRQSTPNDTGWGKFLAGLCCLVLLGFFGCAKKPPPKHRPKLKAPPAAKPAEPVIPALPPSLSPKREASQKFVHTGEEYLEAGELDRAAQTFQEAINIDFENGVAYYFLAKTMYQKETYDEALGLIERAEELLANDPEWLQEVLRLKMAVQEARENKPAVSPPSNQDVYY